MGLVTGSRHVRRYAELARLAVKYGRSDLVRELGMESHVDERPGEAADATELARDLEALGPTYVKLGQLLSTRADLIPPAYAAALSRLQDRVEPVPGAEIERLFEAEVGVRPSYAFAQFDFNPLASASLGQVHRARLRTGAEVVVKVQRPDIRAQIDEDMEALREVARLLDEHTDVGRRLGFVDLLDEFDRTLRDELDYTQEAANLLQLRRIVAPYDRLVVPAPILDFCTERVLTMEYLAGRKVTELGPLAQLELGGRELADQLFRAYLDQILVAGFFHADPHPGNVSVTADHRLALLDLGMVARVPPSLQDALVKLLVAVSEGRGEEAARITIGIGERLDGFDEARFVRGAADLVARNHDRGVGELDAGVLVLHLTRLSGDAGLRLPPELALLGKAMLNLDQVARTLDPGFEPSATVRAHADAVLRGRLRPSRERLVTAALDAREFVEELPGRVNKLMDAAANGELTVRVDAIDEQELLRGIQKVANRITVGLLLAALIIGAAMLTRVETGATLLGYPAVAIVCFLLAAAGAVALGAAILYTDHRRR